MKKQIITSVAITLLATGIIFSCKKKDETVPESQASTTTGSITTGILSGYNGPINTSAIQVYVIDTAKINTITQIGTNETTIINKYVNTSSFINNFNTSLDGSKIVYTIYQQAPFSGTVQGVVSRELRIANNNGTNDVLLNSHTSNSTDFGAVRYGLNNKIYFTKDTYGPTVSHQFCSVNNDGTNFQTATTYYTVDDISVDGNYFITHSTNSSTGNYTSFTIIDKNGDNGAGSQYFSVNVSDLNLNTFKNATFAIDNKRVVIPYHNGTNFNIIVVDLVSKTTTTKTFTSINASQYDNITLNMASDSNRGIVTVSGVTSSISYIIDINAGTVLNQYTNNDANVYMVYPY